MICVDERFRPLLNNNILVRPSSLNFKADPSDFLQYAFVMSKESITDCASLVVYQSNLALIPEQFSEARKRL